MSYPRILIVQKNQLENAMDELILARLRKQREEAIAQGVVAPEKF